MEVSFLEPDDPRWIDVLGRARHDFYHVPGYVRVAATHEGGRPGALLIADGGDAILWPQIERDVPGTSLKDLASPYGYPGPISTASSAARTIDLLSRGLPEALAMLRARGVVSLFARLHPILDDANAALGKIGTLVEHGSTISIDATSSDEEAFAQYRTMNRRHVRAARRSGFVARHDPELERLDAFITLYEGTMKRIGASPYYFFPMSYYVGLKEALGDRLSIWFAERDGEIGAAVLFTEVCGIVQYHLSANDERFAAVHPTKLVIDVARSWAHARGDTCLHLGGGLGGSEDSLFFFKAGFSSRRHTFRTLRAVLDEDAYTTLARARPSAPDPAIRTGFFPAYRAT